MTRLLLYHLSLIGALAFAAYAIAMGVRRLRPGTPGPALAVVTGVTVATVVVLRHADSIADIVAGPRDYPAEPSIVIFGAFLAAAFVAFALADTVLFRIPEVLRDAATAAAAVALVVSVAAIVVSIDRIQPSDAAPGTAAPATTARLAGTVDATLPLPGGPLDIVMDGPRTGYMSVHPDAIYRFQLTDDGEGIELEIARDGLDSPRGLAISNGTLFATTMGQVLCPDPANLACRPDLTPEQVELETIAISGGGVIAMDIAGDGSLGPPRRIVEGLPTTAFDHGVNALESGPDGRLYATVGGLSGLGLYPDLMAQIGHPNRDLIGTVISFLPDGSDLSVFARGLRNAYDVTFTPSGEMYTADNDGEALNALRLEEILHVTEGAHFGYPVDGSFEPFTDRTEGPTWILEHVGSSGVEWVEDLSGTSGLVVGALSSVTYVEFGTRAGAPEPLVGSRTSVRKLVEFAGYATTVDQLDDGRLLIGVFSPWDPTTNMLLVVSVP